MTTKYVTFCTSYKPDCAFVPNAEVIVCLKDDALVVQFEPPCGLPLTTILATICGASRFEQGCQNFIYQYTFSYDDEQITDPSTRPLIESDIETFLCQDCLIDYIQQQISCVEGGSGGSGSVVPYYSDMCDGSVTDGVDTTELLTFDFPADYLTECGQRINFTLTGTFVRQDEVEEITGSITLNLGGAELYELDIDFSDIVTEEGTWLIQGYIARAPDQPGGVCFGSNIYSEITTVGEGGTDRTRVVDVTSITTPIVYDFTVSAEVLSVDSSITLGQVVVDYYGSPVVCGENVCCDG